MQTKDSVALIFQDQILERLFTDLMLMGCKNSEKWNDAVLSKGDPISSIVVYFYMGYLTKIYTDSSVLADEYIDFQKEDYETAIEKVFNLLNR